MSRGFRTTYKGGRGQFSAFALAGILLLPVGAGAWGHDRDKALVTEFEGAAAIAFNNLGFGPKRLCVPIGVALESGDFFDGLQRVRGPHELQFHYRKRSQPVLEFPDSLLVQIRVVPGNCSLGEIGEGPHPPLAWDEKFMRSWRFRLDWLSGGHARPVEIISSGEAAAPSLLPRDMVLSPIRTGMTDGGWLAIWEVRGYILMWRYYFWVRSQSLPITENLRLEVVAPDGQVVARLIGGMDRALPSGP